MSTQSPEWITASRVLRRSGFGARGNDVDAAVAAGGPDVYVAGMLAADFTTDPGVLATPMPEFAAPERPGENTAESEPRRYREQLNAQMLELTCWWVRRMIAAEEPAREKLTFLWHNHFATSGQKVKVARLMAQQNEKLRSLCLGDFRALAYAMLTDAAMISWLDGRQNVAGSANENLAREFMELFALGHGNSYSERDVREGARALTGWKVRLDGDAVLVSHRHDGSTKTVLSTTGAIGSNEFCDIVLADANSARFIASRLWQQLASGGAPSRQTLRQLVAAYGPNRDLRALTIAILTSSELLDGAASVVSGPLEWLVGVARALHVTVDEPTQAERTVAALKSLGQRPFYPPDVGGWPSGQAWLSTSAAAVRLQTANKLVQNGDLSVVADSPVEDRIDAVGYMIGVGSWSDATVKALRPLQNDSASLVTAAVITPEYLTS